MSSTASTVPVPQALREAWTGGDWRPIRDEAAATRTPALPELKAMLDRFLRAETGLAEFAKESQDLSFAQPHWGFKGFAQMQLNQYAKVAQAANLVEETERVLRATLPAPSDDAEALTALQELLALTQKLADEATRLGIGKPAPGRVPFVVSYFWEAQDRQLWPIAYRASKEVLAEHGLYHEADNPADSYLTLRNAILGLGRELGGDVWDIEALLWLLRPKREAQPQPPPSAPAPGTATAATVPDVYTAYRDQELVFQNEVITTFLLSLWTKPFVILTGISGTGKTRIAQVLAHALEPGTTESPTALALEPGDEQHSSFRVTDWTLKSGRLYLGIDQLPAFDVPERGSAMNIAVSFPDGGNGALRLNNIDLSATTRELRLLFANASMRRWLVDHASPGDVLRLDFQAADQASASIVASQRAGAPRRRLLVPVRADWTDSRGLLGFWNPIFDRYERTDVVDLLLRAADDLEHPYFLILDEMNLARVEYYFSDFLSAMESGEAIPLHSEDALDETVPASLRLPPNVFVVGTVNIDETTHAFSPKVLDRASVIEFNDVLIQHALSGADETLAEGGFRLNDPTLRAEAFQAVEGAARRELKTALVEEGPTYSERLTNLHALLERYHLHFGYRVIDEITTFVALARQRVGDDEASLATAFDLAVCQKVLPKLNGGRELDEPLRRLLAFLIDPDATGDEWRGAEERWNTAHEARRDQGEDSEVAYPRSSQERPHATPACRDRLRLVPRMSGIALLETQRFKVVGPPGTIDPSSTPPLLYAEETYVVRPRPGGVVRPGLAGALAVLPGAQEGRLRFGNFAGLAELDGCIVRVDSRRISAPAADRMVEELVEAVRGLPSRALPPTGSSFDRPLAHAEDVDLLAYLVVRDAVRGHGPHDLSAAMARILARPHERLIDERSDRPIWAADRIDGRTIIELASRPVERIRVPLASPLAGSPIALLPGGVPARVRVGHPIPTTDTLENRFVATALDSCLAIVRTVAAHAARGSSAAMAPLRAEAVQLAATLERWRLHRVLEDLRPLRRLPTTSTVLRGRPGYRDVLRLYADLLGRTRIVPPAAAIRIVGLRDVATLYEWWSFFQVISAVSDALGPPERLDPAAATWQGAELGQGLTAWFAGDVRVEFNRSFSRSQSGKHRSYSVTLRPDILVETPRERHIFDAKFAFEPLGSSLSDDDDDNEDESIAGRARRWHIHKMHTYRDALDRVASVRVLYPGSIAEWYPVGAAGARQGVGSLPLRVGNSTDTSALHALLRELIESPNAVLAHPAAAASN